MTLRRWVFSAVAGVAVAYAVYPYVTLYRLASAVSAGDSRALSALVSWDSVREGVKEDICDAVADLPPEQPGKEAALRPFGYSFVRGVAANVVDANITPESLVSAANSTHFAADSWPRMRVNWAFFHSPTRFDVAIGLADLAGPGSELRMQMAFRHGKWIVTRAWLPSAMLIAANSRT